MSTLLIGYNPRKKRGGLLSPLAVGSLNFAVADGESYKEVSESAWSAHLNHPNYGSTLRREMENGTLRVIPKLAETKLDQAEDLIAAADSLTVLDWWSKAEARKTAKEWLRDRVAELTPDDDVNEDAV